MVSYALQVTFSHALPRRTVKGGLNLEIERFKKGRPLGHIIIIVIISKNPAVDGPSTCSAAISSRNTKFFHLLLRPNEHRQWVRLSIEDEAIEWHWVVVQAK